MPHESRQVEFSGDGAADVALEVDQYWVPPDAGQEVVASVGLGGNKVKYISIGYHQMRDKKLLLLLVCKILIIKKRNQISSNI